MQVKITKAAFGEANGTFFGNGDKGTWTAESIRHGVDVKLIAEKGSLDEDETKTLREIIMALVVIDRRFRAPPKA